MIEPLALPFGGGGRERVADLRDVYTHVPEIEIAQRSEPAHVLAIGSGCCEHDVAPLGVVEAAIAGAISKLAASRLTSHSHGPGRVSSKSLMSKTRSRSGAA